MSRQVSRGSAGEYQAYEQAVSRGSVAEYQVDERAGVARLSWRVSGRWAGRCRTAPVASIRQMNRQVSGRSGSWCRRRGFNSWFRKIPWRRAWQPTPVFLPGESHGQKWATIQGITKSRTWLKWLSRNACTTSGMGTDWVDSLLSSPFKSRELSLARHRGEN